PGPDSVAPRASGQHDLAGTGGLPGIRAGAQGIARPPPSRRRDQAPGWMTPAGSAQTAWGGEASQRDAWPTRHQELLLQAALLPGERGDAAWREVRPRLDVAQMDGATLALLPTLRRNLVTRGVEDE